MSRQQRRLLERQRTAAAKPASTNPVVPPSTGPRTSEGKAISARNALSHGLTASSLVLPWENKADFDGMLDDLVAEHRPATITEQIMVKEMAENYWRLGRARGHEHTLLAQSKLILEKGTVDPNALASWEKSLALAQRYITRFERGFHKCLSTLRTLQKERRLREAEEEAEAAEAQAQPETEQLVASVTAVHQIPGQFVSQNPPDAAETSQNSSIRTQAA